MLGSFVRQLSLSCHGNSMESSIIGLYKDKQKKGFASGQLTLKECQDALLQLCRVYRQTTLVLDALDECDRNTRDRLMNTMEMLVRESPNMVKVLFSSRPDLDIKDRFEGGSNLVIQATDNQTDISMFVEDAILRSSPSGWRKRIPLALQTDICETLIDKSDGM